MVMMMRRRRKVRRRWRKCKCLCSVNMSALVRVACRARLLIDISEHMIIMHCIDPGLSIMQRHAVPD